MRVLDSSVVTSLLKVLRLNVGALVVRSLCGAPTSSSLTPPSPSAGPRPRLHSFRRCVTDHTCHDCIFALCRRHWTVFNGPLMVLGTALLLMCLCAAVRSTLLQYWALSLNQPAVDASDVTVTASTTREGLGLGREGWPEGVAAVYCICMLCTGLLRSLAPLSNSMIINVSSCLSFYLTRCSNEK